MKYFGEDFLEKIIHEAEKRSSKSCCPEGNEPWIPSARKMIEGILSELHPALVRMGIELGLKKKSLSEAIDPIVGTEDWGIVLKKIREARKNMPQAEESCS